ncbi:hypothetical protein ACEPAF_7566 [Sanghuangporus sanghuang]
MSSPIPIISVDDSACNLDYEYDCSPQYLSVPSAPVSAPSRRASFHPGFIAGRLMPRRRMMPPPPARPTRPARPPPPTTQQIRASVMCFLEQQEREMRLEVQRVGTEIRDLRRCVRAVKREQSQIQARSQFRNDAQTRVRFVPVEEFESGSGSDADTEEVNVVVIAAN